MKFLSVTIPTYEMNGKGMEFLRHSFDILAKQTFKDFDVVISDHSKDDGVKNLCEEYKDKLDIKYYRNTENLGSSSANLNNAIKHAEGKLIKILFQDDFLYDEYSLQHIVENFDLEKDYWLVTGSEHSNDGAAFTRPFLPVYNHLIHLGNNTISSPSVLTIKNDQPLLFDEKLIWLMDVDYYKRCHIKFGEPKILNKICSVNRSGEHQVTNTLATNKVKREEKAYVAKKFEEIDKLQLSNVTLVAVSSVKMEDTIKALLCSMEGIHFKEAVLVSHEKPALLDPRITFKQCEKITSLDAYSKFMLYDLARYIDTDFALVIQHDGYVVRPERWDPAFLEYDYIGAPWPYGAHFTKEGDPVLVGNGGFSLRSKKLMNILNEKNLPFTDGGAGYYNEDGVICNYYKKELEGFGIRFAPPELASKFSLEDSSYSRALKPFGFHRNKKFIPLALRLKHLFK